jgi:hypothetical protein
MSFGGFLGIRERYHPLPWRMLTYDTGLGGYVVDVCVFRRKAAAESDASRPVIPTETSHPFRGKAAIPDPG